MIINTKVTTISCIDIFGSQYCESYVATYSDLMQHAIDVATIAKIAMDFNCPCSESLFSGLDFLMKGDATCFFPPLQDRFYIHTPRFGYGTVAVKSRGGGSRGSPFSQWSPKFTRKMGTWDSHFYGGPQNNIFRRSKGREPRDKASLTTEQLLC